MAKASNWTTVPSAVNAAHVAGVGPLRRSVPTSWNTSCHASENARIDRAAASAANRSVHPFSRVHFVFQRRCGTAPVCPEFWFRFSPCAAPCQAKKLSLGERQFQGPGALQRLAQLIDHPIAAAVGHKSHDETPPSRIAARLPDQRQSPKPPPRSPITAERSAIPHRTRWQWIHRQPFCNNPTTPPTPTLQNICSRKPLTQCQHVFSATEPTRPAATRK